MSLRLMYSPILLRSIAQVLNHHPSPDLESGDTTNSGKKILFAENLQGAILQMKQKGWQISSEDWWGLDYQSIH